MRDHSYNDMLYFATITTLHKEEYVNYHSNMGYWWIMRDEYKWMKDERKKMERYNQHLLQMSNIYYL